MVRKTKGAIISVALFLAIAGATATVSNFVYEPLTVYAEEQTEYTFGTNVIGTLSSDGKTLTISVKDTLETGRAITSKLSAVLSEEQCSAIETIKILDGVSSIPGGFAEQRSNLKKLILPDNIQLGANSFINTGITDLTVPENLTAGFNTAGYPPFNGCELNLKFSKSTTKIGANVFSKSNIKELDFTNSNINYIGADCFNACTKLESVILKDGITLEANCFRGTTSLKYIEIPNVTYSYNEAWAPFLDSGIKKVSFKYGLTEIQPSLCMGMKELVNIQIPSTVTKIGDGAFVNCTLLQSVTIPSTVETIGYRSFKGCTSLESVNIPNNVTIRSEAFANCSKLERVTLPIFTYQKNYCDGIFNSSGIKILEIQDGVTNLYTKQFYNDQKLQIIYIPDSVTEIASDTFSLASTPAFTTKVVTNNEYAKGLDWETLFNRPVEFISTTIEASDSSLGNEGALVSGEISPVTTLDVSIPVSGGSFYIDEKRNVSSRPLSVQNNSNAPVSVYLIDTEKNSTEPDLIPIDTYTDTEWANLSEEDTLNYLGMAINGKDIAGTFGNIAKESSKKIYICDLGSGYTYTDIQNLPINVKFGKMFTNSEILNMTYNLTFEFTIKQ